MSRLHFLFGVTVFAAPLCAAATPRLPVVWAQLSVVPPGSTGEVLAPTVSVPTGGGGPTNASPVNASPVISSPGIVSQGRETRAESPATTGKTPLPCQVSLAKTESLVAAEGGSLDFAARFKPESCKSVPRSQVAWLKSTDSGKLRFSVEPNSSPEARETVLEIAGASLRIKQQGAQLRSYAAAPGAPAWTVERDTTAKQFITVWADGPKGLYTIQTGNPSTPWLRVAKQNQQRSGVRIELLVDSRGLTPGDYVATVEIHLAGALNSPLRIPIRLQVIEKRKKS